MEPAARGAIFFDGASSRRREVAVGLTADGLVIAEGEARLALWRYDDLRERDGGPRVLRLANVAGPELARLEIADEALAGQVRLHARNLAVGREGSRAAGKIVFWSLAAAASLLLIAFVGVPLIADRLAPLVPLSVERRIGVAVDRQVRAIFDGKECAAPEGRAAFDKLMGALTKQIATPFPIEPAVLASSTANAVALPGGKVYVLDGLIQKSKSADEVAAVVAHEIGHVAERDGMRHLIQNGGTSFLIGLLFGDVTGSAVVLTAARSLASASYSRTAETRADRHAIDAMLALGRSPVPLGELLTRITGESKRGPFDMLSSHPLSSDRLDAMRAADRPVTAPPLLTDEEWRALKAICAAKS